jgi:glutamine amidotransferase
MPASIAVVDYDMGNLHSACKGLEKVGATPKITDSVAEIERADAVVLPGVGHLTRRCSGCDRAI